MTGLYLITSLLLHHVHESRKEYFLLSTLPLTPPERNPGHRHQNVADIRGGNKTNNSSVQLDHLLTSEAPASPTLYTQGRRESSSPEHALKPHHIVHVHIYIFKQLVQSSYNHRTPARGSEAGVSVLQLH